MKAEKILSDVYKYVGETQEEEDRKIIPPTVPVSGTRFSPIDIVNLVDVALGGWITEGKASERFANKLSKFCGSRHATLCNSGSSANLLALTAIKEHFKVPNKSFVVTSALAFPTTVAPIIQNGLVPLFVDIDPNTLNPKIDTLVRLSHRENVAGIILAHTLGFPFNSPEVCSAYREQGKFIIEDCCDALGAMASGNPVGSFADASTYSFFPAHHISCGEGGAVLCNDGRLHKTIQSYSNWGRDCWCKPGEQNTCGKRFDWKYDDLPEHYDHKYIFSRLGYNLKMTDLQAALGSSQMDRIDEIVFTRRVNWRFLADELSKIPGFLDSFRLVSYPKEVLPSPFGFPLTCIGRLKREYVISFLESTGIRTRPIFSGNITKHPMMKGIEYISDSNLSGCDFVMKRSFWIGCHPQLTPYQLSYIVETFKMMLEAVSNGNN